MGGKEKTMEEEKLRRKKSEKERKWRHEITKMFLSWRVYNRQTIDFLTIIFWIWSFETGFGITKEKTNTFFY